MRYQLSILTLLLLTSLLVHSHVVSQTPQDDSTKPLYYATGNEASIVGTISVTGTIPKAVRIDMTADPVCMELDSRPETESLIVNENKLKNAFVYLKGGPLEQYRFATPTSELTLERNKCRYSPHVMGM